MRLRKVLMAALVLPVFALTVSGCETLGSTQRAFPNASELAEERKPVLPIEALTSGKVAEDYNATLEGWGERGWARVGQLCRWAKRMGMKGAPC